MADKSFSDHVWRKAEYKTLMKDDQLLAPTTRPRRNAAHASIGGANKLNILKVAMGLGAK
jgi:hypothetical protein